MKLAALVPCHLWPPPSTLMDELDRHVAAVVVVGDGLTSSALEAVARRANASTVILERRSGKGTAVAAGLEHILRTEPGVDGVVVIDADGQHPPAAIPRFVAAAERGAELVIGDRFDDSASMPVVRRLANRLTSRLFASATGRPVRDTQCGMRLLTGRALVGVPFPSGAYESETRHLRRCLAAGVHVAWVPIPAIYQGEPSSFRGVRDGLRILAAVVRL